MPEMRTRSGLSIRLFQNNFGVDKRMKIHKFIKEFYLVWPVALCRSRGGYIAAWRWAEVTCKNCLKRRGRKRK